MDVNVCDDFPPNFLEALGRYAVEFGRVEYLVKVAVKSLFKRTTKTKLSGGIKAFEAGVAQAEKEGQFGRVCKKAKTLAAQGLSEAHALTFIALIERATTLAEERNDNLHALWTGIEQKSFRYRPFWNRETKELEWRNDNVAPADLDRLTEALRALGDRLREARAQWP